jgi:hypothetical protein
LKNNHIRLFGLGIVLGGTIVSALFGASQIRNLFSPDPASTVTPNPKQLPLLIALESNNVLPRMTPTPIHPTRTAQPSLGPNQIAVSSTATAVVLRNKQRPEIIGYSVEGRPLEVYTFGSGEQERMIVAGIHGGDEWNTITLANQLIVHLNQNPHLIPKDQTLYILPNLNPDGEARTHDKYGRLNHNGVDLNRNFPVNWKMDWKRDGCWNYLPTSGGTGPGSEAETQSFMNFINNHHVQVLISYHSAALGIFPGGFRGRKHRFVWRNLLPRSPLIPSLRLTQDVCIQVHLQIMRCRLGLPL